MGHVGSGPRQTLPRRPSLRDGPKKLLQVGEFMSLRRQHGRLSREVFVPSLSQAMMVDWSAMLVSTLSVRVEISMGLFFKTNLSTYVSRIMRRWSERAKGVGSFGCGRQESFGLYRSVAPLNYADKDRPL